MSTVVIAMDGTAGSGKSSASRGVATGDWGCAISTPGAMYRAMTWQMLLDGVDVAGPRRGCRTCRDGGHRVRHRPGSRRRSGSTAGDVSREIRSGEVNVAVSPVSAVPRVRELLVAQQRPIIGTGGIVVEGRDIGTVVAPDAALKVYLTADPSARPAACRRDGRGAAARSRAVEQTLVRRDVYDSSRATAPLTVADDAVQLDTTDLTLDQVIAGSSSWRAHVSRPDGRDPPPPNP